ncbi:MAG TPA: hypothetical protein VFN68_05330 [Acidimicrobiales bacterium]|nr:hypothetical protein [Acidimicrobiales bacterium]
MVAVAVGVVAGPLPAAWAGSSPGPDVVLPDGQRLPCPPETFPNGGTPRNGPPTPYEIPFAATIGQTTPTGRKEGGYLSVSNSMVTVTMGGPVQVDPTTGSQYGSVFAYGCGLVELPGEKGTIGGDYGQGGDANFNNEFVFYPDQVPVSMSITGIPGLPLISAYGAVDGQLTAQIEHTPAPNGGLNVMFFGGAKSTADFGPALAALAGDAGPNSGVTLPPSIQSLVDQIPAGAGSQAGSACTLAIGDIVTQGVKDVTATGLTQAQATSPFELTTQASGQLTGRPVTGPITHAQATLVANDFPVGAIVPDPSPTVNSTTPAPGYPGHPYCSPQNASLLNNLLGLPSVPDPATGHYPNTFVSPGTFSVYVSA